MIIAAKFPRISTTLYESIGTTRKFTNAFNCLGAFISLGVSLTHSYWYMCVFYDCFPRNIMPRSRTHIFRVNHITAATNGQRCVIIIYFDCRNLFASLNCNADRMSHTISIPSDAIIMSSAIVFRLLFCRSFHVIALLKVNTSCIIWCV